MLAACFVKMGGVDSLEFEEIIVQKSLSGDTQKHPFRFDGGLKKQPSNGYIII